MEEKKRRINFSAEEKLILKELVTKYAHIVENKKSDAVSAAAKKLKWEEIAEEFSNNSACVKRNSEQLRKCWDNLKTQRKKELAEEKRGRMATGGGPSTYTPIHDPEMDSIPGLDIELKGGIDSDTIALIESGDLTFLIDERGKLVPTDSDKKDTPVIVPANKEVTPPKKRALASVELEGTQRLNNLSRKQEYEEKLYLLRIQAAEMDVYKKKKETEHMEKMQQHEEKMWKEEVEFSRKMWRAKLRSINLEIQRKKNLLLQKKKKRGI